MKNDSTKRHVKNYPELRVYLEESNESDLKRENIKGILEKRLQEVRPDYDFRILDVGCSDGEMFLPLAAELKRRLPGLKYIALEPEKPAFERLVEKIKGQGLDFIQPANTTLEAYLRTIKGQEGLFDLILFAQSFYGFPKSEWGGIISNALRLLKSNGFVMVILDSRGAKVYKLCDSITAGKADTLEFGDFCFAEDLEQFLTDKGISFKTVQYPISIFIKDDEHKLDVFARILAFLYRTFPEKILTNHRESVEKFLEEYKSDNQYVLENLDKVIAFTK